jgi:hypothetical protein
LPTTLLALNSLRGYDWAFIEITEDNIDVLHGFDVHDYTIEIRLHVRGWVEGFRKPRDAAHCPLLLQERRP